MPASHPPDVDRLLGAPLQATWVLTARCNLTCPYCLEDGPSEASPDDVPTRTRETILRELVQCRVLRVNISGGEPLLVDELPEYVERLRGGGAAVRITTNGTLVDEGAADRLARAGLGTAEVTAHPGATDSALRAVTLFAKRKVPAMLRLVVTRSNEAEIEQIVMPFLDAGVETAILQEVSPLGRAMREWQRFALGRDEILDVRDRVLRMRERTGEGRVGFASSTLAEMEGEQPVVCSMGVARRQSCEVRPDGNVLPCTPAITYGVRNMIPERGMAACFRDLPRLYGSYAEEPPGGTCETCAKLAACRGGCRAISHMLTGSNCAGNPLCALFSECPA